VVRGPSPLLTIGIAAIAVAVTLVAPAVPSASSGPAVRIAAVLAAVLIGAMVLSAAWLQGGGFILLALLVGTAMLALAFDATDARAAASVPEAMMWGTLGMAFARHFAQPTVAVAVCLLVAGLALGGIAGDASALTARASAGDLLTLELPAFGGGQALALPALVVVALGAIGTWAPGLALRGGWTVMFVLEALALAVALRVDPVAPVLGAFLLANADRLVTAVREEDTPLTVG
jgi:hypothetical protein